MFFKGDKYSRLELTIYVVSWVIVFCLPFLLQTYDVLSGEKTGYQWDRLLSNMQTLMLVLLLFVLNNWVLLPHLFWKRRKAWYFIVIISVLAVMWYIQEPPKPLRFDGPMGPHNLELEMPRPALHPEHHMGPRPEPRHRPHGPLDLFHIMNLVIELCVLLANFGIKLYIHSLRRDVSMLNIQNEKMVQELQALKYQISPHFLMNTLNNIQSLIETNPKRAYGTIQQLSKMMRYLLYENNTQNVSLKKEVEFMQNFIDLMKIRYPSTVKVSADLIADDKGITIPPLLFISFVENAFKYGVSYTKESMISVKLGIDGSYLTFSCANFETNEAKANRKEGGIGIKNVQRRLDLIYGDDYDLNISQNDGLYLVEMRIPVEIPLQSVDNNV